MKRLLLTGLLVLFCTTISFAQGIPSFLLYKDNYLIAGSKDDQGKAQISVAYDVLYPYYNYGVYIGYTQLMQWQIYESSVPFGHIDLCPEIFWRPPFRYKIIDYIQLSPFEHRSNGIDGQESRSWNRCYAESQISMKFKKKIRVGLTGKVFYPYKVGSKNDDVVKYIGYYEATLFVQFEKEGPLENYVDADQERVYIKGGSGRQKGWIEAGVNIRILTDKFKPTVYFQLFHGYHQFIAAHNQKETAFRVGVSIR